MMKITYRIILLLFIFSMASCNKDLLNEKSDKSLLVPATLADFQSLLDNIITMNSTPALNTFSTDDFYATDNGWEAFFTPMERNSYLWKSDIFEGQTTPDWDVPYQQIFYANVVLDGLAKLTMDSSTLKDFNQMKGSALFYRGLALYNLAQLFALPYDTQTAAQDPGIPIRLGSNVNLPSVRGTVQQTYDQIISDLTTAEGLLPVVPVYFSRPGKTAVEALLARIYLTMENYEKASDYATTSLNLNSQLLDYNTLTPTASRPFPMVIPINSNPEVLYYGRLNSYSFSSSSLVFVDTTLFSSYDPNDLRKTVFYSNNGVGNRFKGSYTGNVSKFDGLANDEVYLIRAESYARQNNVSGALSDLNTLLSNRYVTGTFTPLTASDATEALTIILRERRKELVTRGSRWTDLRRLNKDPRFAITLTRTINNVTYTLPPSDNHYVFPIPPDEVATSGLAQNPR